MRVFYSFLVVLSVVILFMLPITEGVYDFRTDIKEDSFYATTGAAETTTNVILRKEIYEDDTTTVSISSDLYTDLPALVSYNTTTRLMNISGLSISNNRTLTVTYDYDSLEGWDSINSILDKLPWIWLLVVIIFAPAALVSMWVKRG